MGTKNKSKRTKSSTKPQASSPVESKSNRKRNVKTDQPVKRSRIEPFRHKLLVNGTEFVARVCNAVTQAICEFYAQGSTSMAFEDLYKDVYNMVLHRKGEELYSAVETAMASEVQSLCRSLDDAAPEEDDALFLQELLAKWNQHTRAVKMTRGVLMYMDLTYVPTNRKTSVNELALRLWRDNMVNSDKIRPRLVEAVKRQRGGEEVELVAGVNKMLAEIGAEVMDGPCLCFRDGAGKLVCSRAIDRTSFSTKNPNSLHRILFFQLN